MSVGLPISRCKTPYPSLRQDNLYKIKLKLFLGERSKACVLNEFNKHTSYGLY